MRIILFLLSAFFLCGSFASPLSAATLTREESQDFGEINPAILPLLQDAGLKHDQYYNKKFDDPQEPSYLPVKFLKQPPPKTLAQRIDRLIHGIYVDTAPEYDHYGYEIRRMMANAISPNQLNDLEEIEARIENVKKARIIMDYWKESLLTELDAIEEELNKTKGVTKLRTTFRYNQRIVKNFIPDAYAWLDRTLDYLEFVKEEHKNILIKYPFYFFTSYEVKEKFLRVYNARQGPYDEIVKFSPFRSLVY